MSKAIHQGQYLDNWLKERKIKKRVVTDTLNIQPSNYGYMVTNTEEFDMSRLRILSEALDFDFIAEFYGTNPSLYTPSEQKHHELAEQIAHHHASQPTTEIIIRIPISGPTTIPANFNQKMIQHAKKLLTPRTKPSSPQKESTTT